MQLKRVDSFLLWVLIFAQRNEGSHENHEKVWKNEKLNNFEDPEVDMTVDEIIRYHGYPIENHYIQTKDGYILTIQRIPHGKNNNCENAPKIPVLIQHGVFLDSRVWVINTPDKNLAYVLTDACYDVWLGNVRGSIFGLNHTHLSPDQQEFWNFSFEEMALFDVTVTIETMLNVTGFKQIFYIGHSMGTVMMFALLSSQPSYNNIIRGYFALAPAITAVHCKGYFAAIYPFRNWIYWFYNFFNHGKMEVSSKLFKFIGRTLCKSPFKKVCENLVFFIGGFDPQQLNTSRLPVYFAHLSSWTSVTNLKHLFQLKKTINFSKFDYGPEENLLHYGQPFPPLYNLSQITAPVAIFWGQNDYICRPIDVRFLSTKLSNLILNYRVPFDEFNHLDFLWGLDVKNLVYDKILEFMKKL